MNFWDNIELLQKWAKWIPIIFASVGFAVTLLGLLSKSKIEDRIKVLKIAIEAPRSISSGKFQSFERATEGLEKGPVTVQVLYNENEVSSYAREIRNMLNASGYGLGIGAGYRTALLPPKESLAGIRLGIKNEANQPTFAGPLLEVFKNSGFTMDWVVSDEIPEDQVFIYVGLKDERK